MQGPASPMPGPADMRRIRLPHAGPRRHEAGSRDKAGPSRHEAGSRDKALPMQGAGPSRHARNHDHVLRVIRVPTSK